MCIFDMFYFLTLCLLVSCIKHICISVCSMDTRELRFARAMTFAIDEINSSSDLLPGVALGYKIYDSCSSAPMAVQVAFQFTNDPQSVCITTVQFVCIREGCWLLLVILDPRNPSAYHESSGPLTFHKYFLILQNYFSASMF